MGGKEFESPAGVIAAAGLPCSSAWEERKTAKSRSLLVVTSSLSAFIFYGDKKKKKIK